MKSFLFIIFLFLQFAVKAKDVQNKTCLEIIRDIDSIEDSNHVIKKMSSQMRSFYEAVLVPMTGKRLLLNSNSVLKKCAHKMECLLIKSSKDFDEKTLELVIDSSLKEDYQISYSEESYKLVIPPRESYKIEDYSHAIKSWLIGSSYYPYSSGELVKKRREELGEDRVILRSEQKKGIELVSKSWQKGEGRFLFVSPTGSGKSIVYLDHLNERLSKEKSSGLYLLTSDGLSVVAEMANKINHSINVDNVEVIVWKGRSELQLEEILKKSETHNVILISSISLLRSRILSNSEFTSMELLKKQLRTWVYDEGHHLGAEQAYELSKELVDNNQSQRPFLLGLTATPINVTNDLRLMFLEKAYYAWLGHGAYNRPLSDMVKQLSIGIEKGDLPPVKDLKFIKSEDVGADLFIKNEGNSRRYLNPEVYSEVFEMLSPYISSENQSFITVSSYKEVEGVTHELRKRFPNVRFEGLHYKSENQEEILQSFKDGEIDCLVTIKMLSEGVDIPSLKTYINLTATMSPRELLQRIGRLMRVDIGKTFVNVVSTYEFSFGDLKENLDLIDSLFHYDLHGNVAFENHVVSNEIKKELERIRLELKKRIDSQRVLDHTDIIKTLWKNKGRLPKEDKEYSSYQWLRARLNNENGKKWINGLGKIDKSFKNALLDYHQLLLDFAVERDYTDKLIKLWKDEKRIPVARIEMNMYKWTSRRVKLKGVSWVNSKEEFPEGLRKELVKWAKKFESVKEIEDEILEFWEGYAEVPKGKEGGELARRLVRRLKKKDAREWIEKTYTGDLKATITIRLWDVLRGRQTIQKLLSFWEQKGTLPTEDTNMALYALMMHRALSEGHVIELKEREKFPLEFVNQIQKWQDEFNTIMSN